MNRIKRNDELGMMNAELRKIPWPRLSYLLIMLILSIPVNSFFLVLT